MREMIETKQHEFVKPIVSCRLSRINQLLGTHLAMSEVETLFHRLGFSHAKISDDRITVQIPTYRHDIHHEIDLVEEVRTPFMDIIIFTKGKSRLFVRVS